MASGAGLRFSLVIPYLLGSLLLLTYAIRIGDAVFSTGQSSGFLVYSRNLYLIRISGQDAAPATLPRSENPPP